MVFRFRIVLVFVFLAVSAEAQNYLRYHKKISEAEEQIVQGNYDEAVKTYDTLLREYKFCFPKDCYVAAQVAAYLHDNENCRFFLLKGIQNGLSPNCLTINPHLRAWAATSGIKPEGKTIDSIQRIYHAGINPLAKEWAERLFSSDQQAVHQPGSIYTKAGDLRPELRLFWDSLYTEIKQLTMRYGFPAERIAGVAPGNDHKITCKNSAMYFILIHHGMIDHDFESLLLKEIDLGNISPEIYAGIADIGRDYDSRKFYSIQTCNAELKMSKCKRAVAARLEEINKNRLAIGLPTYQCQEQMELSRLNYYKALHDEAMDKPYFDFTFVHFQN